MKNKDGFIFTTASSIEGYKIVAQYGIVYGETVFKHGYMARFGASLSNAVDTIAWGSREMSGTMELIEQAREYAYKKIIQEAEARGANAIIAIDSDNTIGGDIMYISLYGTAVKAIKEAEYETQIRAQSEAEKKRLADEENRKAEAAMQIDEQLARSSAGELAREEAFMQSMADAESVMEIWKLWSASDLCGKYPEITKKIKLLKESERLYGKMANDTRRLKNSIRISLLGE